MSKRIHMKSKGFTLIELIIVIAIVGALSILAVPVYKNYIEKTKAKVLQKNALVKKSLS